MPCSRRQEQHRAFSCHPAWRQAHLPGSLFAAILERHQHDGALHPVWRNQSKARTSSDEDDAHVLRMDVPGVKADRISVEEKNGEIEITALRMNGEEEVSKVYQEVFYLNPFRFDIDHAKATLTNGVLTLRIPKNEGRVKKVPVETASVPSDLPSNIFQHTLDLPGVPTSTLEVNLVEDRVHLVGKRSLGDKRVLVQRGFEVPPSMDTVQARALLQDGVFTFLAPIHEAEEGQLRTIFVHHKDEDAAIEVDSSAAMADMKITDEEAITDSNTIKEDDMNVETVDEETESKETDSWEQVASEEEKK
ncbi:unnamed protein product [Cylindrotheca closterium]|uniref:SHSP domain-containing protein n=1 Tax=Cylindrotheca closterium TaxID=2856 RepID=A0AAD2CSJ1_9STRA|nr:unnamed protein product [Cylindrotheca closterium]